MLGFLQPPARRAEPPPAYEFLPAFLRVQEEPPAPLPRAVLYVLLALLGGASTWMVFGQLDIVASAEGRLVPESHLKIVQPAEPGVLRDILVGEGAEVSAGQVLLRLDASVAEADTRALQHEILVRRLQLRRVDAELADRPLLRAPDDADDPWQRTFAQWAANRRAYQDALAQEDAAVARIAKDLRAAVEVRTKLEKTVPIYRSGAQRFATLRREGFVSELFALERERELIEREQDLQAQQFTVAGLEASLAQARHRLAQVTSAYRQQLHTERAAAEPMLARSSEELAKQLYRNRLVELTAPQDGIVKEIATYTRGAVVAPGTVLVTIVPHNDALHADVLVHDLDAGFVHVGQRAKVKVATYPFQKYGTIEGVVTLVTADATAAPAHGSDADASATGESRSGYRARVTLLTQALAFDDALLALASGMQVTAEINLGQRSVLEYLLAPIRKAWVEAGRER
jgi:HlyD family secretion protein